MKSKHRYETNHLFSLLTSKFSLIGTVLLSLTATMPALANEELVLPPNLPALQKTYSVWSARWWQRMFELPTENHPLFDETGENCAKAFREGDKAFFLVGVINVSGTATRNCTIPKDTYIFFPVLNVECSKIELNGNNAKDLRTCANGFIDDIIPDSLSVILDGVSLPSYRVESPTFQFNLPNDNVLGINNPNPNTPICKQTLQDLGRSDDKNRPVCQSAGDGYYVMLKPLSPGSHTLSFAGTYDPTPGTPGDEFALSIVYNLTIQ